MQAVHIYSCRLQNYLLIIIFLATGQFLYLKFLVHPVHKWIMRSITSLVVILSAVSYYFIMKRNIRKMTTDSVYIGSRQSHPERKEEEHNYKNNNKTKLASSLLYVALVSGSVSIFSNSITSHNAGVTLLSISFNLIRLVTLHGSLNMGRWTVLHVICTFKCNKITSNNNYYSY